MDNCFFQDDVKAAGLGDQEIEHIDLVHLAIADTGRWPWYRVHRPSVPAPPRSCRWCKAFWQPGSAHREIHVDAAVALLVGIGQRTPGDVASYAQVVELGLVSTQTGFDVSQALAASQLRESHAEKLIEIRKSLGGISGGVALHAAMECVKGQMLHELCEHLLA